MGAGDAESAAVLTPYNGQVRLIRSILKSKAGDLYNKVAPLFPCCTCCTPTHHQPPESKSVMYCQLLCEVVALAAWNRSRDIIWLRDSAGLLVAHVSQACHLLQQKGMQHSIHMRCILRMQRPWDGAQELRSSGALISKCRLTI